MSSLMQYSLLPVGRVLHTGLAEQSAVIFFASIQSVLIAATFSSSICYIFVLGLPDA